MNKFSQSSDDVVPDEGPHAIVFSLDFAALGCLFVLGLNRSKIYLECPEDVLPDVLEVCCVSEGEHGVFLVD